jgi:hypothetical protein
LKKEIIALLFWIAFNVFVGNLKKKLWIIENIYLIIEYWF